MNQLAIEAWKERREREMGKGDLLPFLEPACDSNGKPSSLLPAVAVEPKTVLAGYSSCRSKPETLQSITQGGEGKGLRNPRCGPPPGCFGSCVLRPVGEEAVGRWVPQLSGKER